MTTGLSYRRNTARWVLGIIAAALAIVFSNAPLQYASAQEKRKATASKRVLIKSKTQKRKRIRRGVKKRRTTQRRTRRKVKRVSRKAQSKPSSSRPTSNEKPVPTVTRKIGGKLDLALPDLIESTGLLKKLLPDFSRKYGVTVVLHILNSGKSIERLRRGKVQALIADDIAAEIALIKNKHSLFRKDVMYTELLIVGPRADPAGIAGMVSVIEALKAIARSESLFVSRGDESGVARAEKRFWKEIGQIPSPSKNRWYRRSGADMRTTVGLAVARNAYTLVDKATWLGLGNRKQLAIMVTGDPRMELRFGVSVLNPATHASKKIKAAQAFAEWITGKAIQSQIGEFAIGAERPFVAHRGLVR